MRRCLNCQCDMIENLYLRGELHGERIKLGERLPKKITVKAAVCPECGYIEIYTDDVDEVKKLKKRI